MKVTVTEKHIREGRVGSAFKCPIARAVAEQTSNDSTCVGTETFSFRVGDMNEPFATTVIRYRLPKLAQDFIDDFDQGLDVSPITFVARKVK